MRLCRSTRVESVPRRAGQPPAVRFNECHRSRRLPASALERCICFFRFRASRWQQARYRCIPMHIHCPRSCSTTNGSCPRNPADRHQEQRRDRLGMKECRRRRFPLEAATLVSDGLRNRSGSFAQAELDLPRDRPRRPTVMDVLVCATRGGARTRVLAEVANRRRVDELAARS